jgi:uncharacterized Zn-binding protein involved in type VI secretion
MSKKVVLLGDPLAPHSKPKHASHPRAIAAGSATVLINGIPAAVTGSVIHGQALALLRAIAAGSATVLINGIPAAVTGSVIHGQALALLAW